MTHNDPLSGKTAVVLGFARQGQALARWLPTVGAQVIVSDTRSFGDLADNMLDFIDSPITFDLGRHSMNLVDTADVFFLSGGVSPTIPICVAAQQCGIPLTNDAQAFIERCPAPVVGITGSAGKTTTTTLVGEMCKLAGLKTWVGGNIGDALIDKLGEIQPRDRIIMELSSFQLELMHNSPQVACVLNVTPNHLDRHVTMEAYLEAKAHIFLHQKPDDICIFNYDDVGSNSLVERAPARVAGFSMRDMISDGAFLAGKRLMVAGNSSPDQQPHVVCNRDEIKLRGEHNVANALAACAIAGSVGVPVEVMAEVVRTFMGVPHRLEIVRTVDGVTYINDSIATAPERVIAALHSFTEPLILLAGGRDKKLPWDKLIHLMMGRVRHLITFGEYGATIAAKAREAYQPNAVLENIFEVFTLDEAVKKAAELAHSGDIVLLSPGGTSYDAYEDFQARGEHFRRLVNALEERDPGGMQR